MIKSERLIPYYIFAGALLLFVPFIGSVHLFDWDEINFAECAREMIVTGDYNTVQIDFYPFWEKPPLFIWMQALCMKVFGVNEFAARLPNAIGGAVTLCTIYILGSRISGKKFAWYWVLFYAGSLLPQFYFRSGVIDPWFNLFIMLSLYQFILYTNEFTPAAILKTWDKRIVLSGLFLSLAVLTKGPAAIVIFGLCFLLARFIRRKAIMSWKHFWAFAIAAVIPAGLWFVSLVAQGKGTVILDFIEYQVRLFTTEDAGHGHNFFYHWLVLLFGCIPASAFAMQGMWKSGNSIPFEKHAMFWMRILFWIVLILFSIVKTKIIHYSSLCYFPLTFIAAHCAVQLETGGIKPQRWVVTVIMITSVAISLALFLVPFFDSLVPWMISRGWIKDAFAEASFKAGANWGGWEWLIGIVLLAVSVYGALMYIRNNPTKSIYTMVIGGVVVFTIASIAIVPKVERYTQGAAIEFWESKSTEKCFVQSIGYKSYAYFFYSNVQPLDAEANKLFTQWITENHGESGSAYVSPEQLRTWKNEWILRGKIDRPAYFISKNTFEHEVVKYYPELVKSGQKNGFIFWERIPEAQ